MSCESYGTLTICRGPKTDRIVDRADGTRWCFYCHKEREFRFVVDAPVEPSYYGPNPRVECGTCHTSDGDCFPGRSREWEDT